MEAAQCHDGVMPAVPPRGEARPRVLVVDDHAAVLHSYRQILGGGEGAGHVTAELGQLESALFGAPCTQVVHERPFEVDTFCDGQQACVAAAHARDQGRPYAVAFVDMRMPAGWDGLQTIERLWQIDARLQVVICTAHSDHAWPALRARLGRNDRLLILRKPFEPIEVQQLADALAHKWLLTRQQQARLADLERAVDARVTELKRVNRTLRMLTHCNEALMRATDESALLSTVCRLIVEIGGYRLAWVGYARDDAARSVEPMAHAGTDRDYVDALNLSWGDDEQRRGVGGAAIREGRPMIARSIATAPAFRAWRCQALARGLASCIALPLQRTERVLGTLSIYADETDAFDADETRLLMELAADLSYGIASLRETADRKRIEQELQWQAGHDRLTGLANRFTLEARAAQCLADARRRGRQAALLFIDLDRFKLVNDTLGHAMGDRLLVTAARRLQGAVRESDIVARLSGDEFAVFLADVNGAADAATVARKLVARLAETESIEHHELPATASIGASLFPADGDDVATLLRNADTAMYSAKAGGGSAVRFYTPEMNAHVAARFALEADLRRALERGELALHYQPQVSLANGVLCGAEALVRWQHPHKGTIAPADFIPLAEDTGLIHPLGDWVIAQVCAQVRAWLDAGLEVPPVSLNLSARQFRRDDLVVTIERALTAQRLDARLLDVEITESAMLHDVEAASRTVQRLKALGVRISLDDFGTGYSSLSHLKRFPIDRLKIDRSFVQDVTTDPDDAAICNAIIGLAHNLNLAVIAEGVETEAQMAHLRRRCCDEMQGYLFSRPLPPQDFARLLGCDERLALSPQQEGQRTLLLVDDEDNVVTALRRLLFREGYRILTARSAEEALQRLGETEVDVILSDHRMPGMTGVELLRHAKALYPDTVRMMLSGYAEVQAIAAAVNEGAVYKFLTKPWTGEQLRANVAEAFRRREMTDENRRLTRELQRLREVLITT